MDDILAKKNRHLFLEEKDNQNNSFIGNINDVANRKTELDTVATHIESVDTVGNHIDNVDTVANNISDINDAVDNIATVKTFNDNINNGTVQYFIEALTTSLDEQGNAWEVRLTQLGESILATTSAFNYSTVVTVSSDIPANGTLMLPNSMKYKVGTHMLMVSWNGTVCYAGEQYEEVGAYGVWATSIKLNQPAKAGDKIQLRIVALNDQSSYVDITEAAINASQFVASGSNTERYLPEFLGDVVNVKNFGAIGNGVNDDTTAFQSAITSGKAVFVPEGTYKLNTDFDGVFCGVGNSIFTGGTVNGSTILRGVAQKNSDIINVKDFGAKGDGTTSDSDAISRAMVAAAARGGCIVFFPAGTYLISYIMSIYSNITVVGENRRSIIKRGYDYWYDSGGNPHTLMVQFNVISGDEIAYIHDIRIEGMTFDAQGVTYDGIPLDIVATGSVKSTGIEISHCRFLDVYEDHALDLGLVNGAYIHDCEFLGYTPEPDTGVRYREAIQFDLSGEDKDDERTKDVVVERCIFGPSDNMNGWMSVLGNHGFSDYDIKQVFQNVVFRNNIIYGEDNESPILRLYVFESIIIEENYFVKCPVCATLSGRTIVQENPGQINSRSTSKIVFSKNLVKGNRSENSINGVVLKVEGWEPTGAYIPHEPTVHVIVSDNYIEDIYQFIQITGYNTVKGFFIKNNTLKNASNVVSCNGGFQAFVVESNLFENTTDLYFSNLTSSPVFLNPAEARKGIVIMNNTWVNPSGRAVNIRGALGCVVSNNFVFDSNTGRTTTYIEIGEGAGAKGVLVKDNVLFSATDDFANFIYSTYADVVINGNKCYANGVEAS